MCFPANFAECCVLKGIQSVMVALQPSQTIYALCVDDSVVVR
ncbi:hypothetical protein Hanom_Chr08g00738391 [Helianthus anomalus]